MESAEPIKTICMNCMGIMFIGGAEDYDCMYKAEVWKKMSSQERARVLTERIEIVCDKFKPAPSPIRVKMQEMVEVGITQVFGNGSVQIPSEIRKILEIQDGDKILWIRKGFNEFTFRKIGSKQRFKPHYV